MVIGSEREMCVHRKDAGRLLSDVHDFFILLIGDGRVNLLNPSKNTKPAPLSQLICQNSPASSDIVAAGRRQSAGL